MFKMIDKGKRPVQINQLSADPDKIQTKMNPTALNRENTQK